MREQAASSLAFCTGWLYRLLRRHVQDEGVRFPQLMVLADLHVVGKASPKDIAEIEQIRRPTLSKMIKDMQASGLIDSEDDPQDGRGLLLKITPKGRRELKRQGRIMAKVLVEILDDLSDDDVISMQKGLNALQDRLLLGMPEGATVPHTGQRVRSK